MALTSSLSAVMKLLLLIALIFEKTQAKPQHLSGPDDLYVFKENDAQLICQVTAVEGYAVVWHAVDGNGAGIIVGRCYICSMNKTCSVEAGKEGDYIVSREGDSYILTIVRPQIPKTAPFGHIQCGYQKIQICDSTPTVVGRFYLFQSAIVYVYDFPSCSSSVTTLSGTFLQDVDLTCTWTPRFYDNDNEEQVKVELNINSRLVQPDVRLPHGIVKRITGSPQELAEISMRAMCTVALSGNQNRSCHFSLPSEENVNVLIDPLKAEIRTGNEQTFYCLVTPNSSRKRIWSISEEGGPYTLITTSIRSMAGDVHLYNDSIKLTNPQKEGTQYFIECSVHTTDGRKVSAFASVMTLGTENTPDSHVVQPVIYTTSTDVQRSSVKLESTTTTTTTAKSDNMVGILTFTIVPIALIIIFFVIGFAIVWKRTRKRNFKQPPRMMEVNYSHMGSNDNMVMEVNNDVDGHPKQGKDNQLAD